MIFRLRTRASPLCPTLPTSRQILGRVWVGSFGWAGVVMYARLHRRVLALPALPGTGQR